MNIPNDPLAWQRQMVQQFPDNELGRFSLGKALYDRGDYAEAAEHLERALAKKPDWMVVQILLGKVALQSGDRDRARADFERALQLAVDQRHEGPQAELEALLADLH
jgi:Flp pilus assembly protein TadD